MTPNQKALVKATVGVLQEHGVTLTTHFYARMFEHNPELKNIFNMGNQQNGRQQTALAMAVLAYAEHIEDPSVLLGAVTKIGHKHTSVHIKPEHYAIVGRHLMASIGEVLGEAATPELLDAWATAYQELADLMMGLERKLYREAAAQPGGWNGWRTFVVKQKVAESDDITSFYLYPADGGPVVDFVPGQYVSVRVFVPALNLFQPRQYSLSCAPNGRYYRISVKKEPGAGQTPQGQVSNYLHAAVLEGDTLELTAPAGDFVLQTDKQTPVVFISGGVGQTPLLSMLEYLAVSQSGRDIVWIHGARNRRSHAFRQPLLELTARHGRVQQHIFYDVPDAGPRPAVEHAGRVELRQLPLPLLPDAEYYLCGPTPFIRKQVEDLTALQVPRSAIFYEEFGPAVLDV